MSVPSASDEPTAEWPPQRRSRAPRLLFGCGVVLATGVLACCIGCAALRLFFGPVETRVPAEVEAVAARVARLRVPPEFRGALALSADNSLFWLQIARFDHERGRGTLVIGEVHLPPLPGRNPYDQQMLQRLVDETAPSVRLLDVKEKQERTLTIRGHEAKFEIVTGEDRASTTRLRQVAGSFSGRQGPAVLILQAEEGFLSDEAIENLLTSLAAVPADDKQP